MAVFFLILIKILKELQINAGKTEFGFQNKPAILTMNVVCNLTVIIFLIPELNAAN